mmetsp:Transcript_66754/g.139111  ORF Transcript_66754/g.139111 Transcript_66754/m.139111 type:complete len:107 (+) Transcript_66754:291-611(+)
MGSHTAGLTRSRLNSAALCNLPESEQQKPFVDPNLPKRQLQKPQRAWSNGMVVCFDGGGMKNLRQTGHSSLNWREVWRCWGEEAGIAAVVWILPDGHIQMKVGTEI